MFDVIHKGSERIDVHEHRAPTDDSLRLLAEMEEKVVKKIIDAQSIDVGGLRCAYVHMEHGLLESVLHLKFSIGPGEPRHVAVKFDDRHLSKEDLARHMACEISRALACELLSGDDGVGRFFDDRYGN